MTDSAHRQVEDLVAALEDSLAAAKAKFRTPRQRWGTCCPNDPECEHSFLDDSELSRWMDSPLSDAGAKAFDRHIGPLGASE